MPVFNHSTANQLALELRSRFRDSRDIRSGRIAQWMLARTDAQLKALFGVNDAQLVTLKQRMQARLDAWTALRNQVGE